MEIIKDILEPIYLLSGPAIAVIAYMALSQIKIAKEQLEEQRKAIVIDSKRDALKTTSEQINEYGKNIIPLINELERQIKEKDLDFFKKADTVIETDKITDKTPLKDEEVDELINMVGPITSVVNALEGFAVFFTSGVADEKIAYLSLSSSYVNTVKKILPLVVRSAGNNNSSKALLELFLLWNERLDKEKLEKEKRQLEEKLRSKKSRTINVVGAED